MTNFYITFYMVCALLNIHDQIFFYHNPFLFFFENPEKISKEKPEKIPNHNVYFAKKTLCFLVKCDKI